MTEPDLKLVTKHKDRLESEEVLAELSKVMPFGSPQAFSLAARTAIYRNQALNRVKWNSLIQCLMDLAQMGLYPDGRRAHLIPFGDSCQLIVDYKGVAELARRHGDVAYIHCDVVHEGEIYICEYGTTGQLKHVPNPDKEDNPIRCAYSHVKIKIPGTEILIDEYIQMSIKQINGIRERSKSKDRGPWVTDFEEMAKKTVFRRHSKTLALSPEVRRAVEYGEEEEFARFRGAVPAIVPKAGDIRDLDDEKEPEKPAKPEKPDKPAKAAQKGHQEAEKSIKAAEAANEAANEADFFQTEPESGESVGESFERQLEHLIKSAGLSKTEFFEWLSVTGVKHRKDPKLQVLTYIDMSTNDLVDCVENWDINLETFQRWLKAAKEGK